MTATKLCVECGEVASHRFRQRGTEHPWTGICEEHLDGPKRYGMEIEEIDQ